MSCVIIFCASFVNSHLCFIAEAVDDGKMGESSAREGEEHYGLHKFVSNGRKQASQQREATEKRQSNNGPSVKIVASLKTMMSNSEDRRRQEIERK